MCFTGGWRQLTVASALTVKPLALVHVAVRVSHDAAASTVLGATDHPIMPLALKHVAVGIYHSAAPCPRHALATTVAIVRAIAFGAFVLLAYGNRTRLEAVLPHVVDQCLHSHALSPMLGRAIEAPQRALVLG